MSEECKVKHEQLSSDISVLLERIKNIHDEEVLLRNDLRNNLLDETRFTGELGDLNQKKAKAERAYVRLVKLGQQANLQEYVNQISVLEECIQQVETDLASLKKRISERIESGDERREWEVDLEDNNTQRLSLRIQLSQLMKERSLLLFQVFLEWIVYSKKQRQSEL